ncbi:hypothetical protein IWZ00DRAFT_263611 [Phyllosticta capitalensis]
MDSGGKGWLRCIFALVAWSSRSSLESIWLNTSPHLLLLLIQYALQCGTTSTTTCTSSSDPLQRASRSCNDSTNFLCTATAVSQSRNKSSIFVSLHS